METPDLAGREIFALHIRRWKRGMLQAYFPDARFVYLPLYLSGQEFERRWTSVVSASAHPAFLVWGSNIPAAVAAFARDRGIPVIFLEDGFIRSLVPNASHTPPLSLTLDRRGLYFDSRHPTDLEVLLSSYDFDADPELMRRARAGIDLLLATRISKYNAPGQPPAARPPVAQALVPKTARRRVLVVGQVEDDASIRLGCDRPIDNNDLVRMAAAENPGSDIFYKPHPDVLNGVRKRLSDPADVAHLATVITQPVALPDLLASVDHVYTITSLAGFETLLRGIPVTVAGCPFYAGWGLTDDRQPNPRRGRKLTVEQLFAAAYLLYPRYFDPVDGSAKTFEECLARMSIWRQTGMPESRIKQPPVPARPEWQWCGPYGLLGWRHLLTPAVAWIVRWAGNKADAADYRHNPILFFRELSDPRLRRVGRLLYPFG